MAPYCRVSSLSEDQRHSFAVQVRYYTEYAQKNKQYVLVDIYADEGITGTSMDKRDDFNRMIRDCQKGLIDRIIVKSIARFARNTEELLMTLRLLKELGVSVYFEEQGIDTAKISNEIIVTLPGMVAQQESVAISENMRWSYKKRMETGEFNCCRSAYGYDLKNGQLVINGPEAKIVRRIFQLYLQGVGKQQIATILNQEAVCKRYGKNQWHRFTIHYILNNERYVGDALLQKSYTTETLPFRKKINHGERPQYYVENSNPPIISREMYQAVQDLQSNRKQNMSQSKHRYPLSGIMRCPDCGRPFRRQIVSGEALWVCSARTSGETRCKSRRIKEVAVYEAFTRMVYKLAKYRNTLLGNLICQIELMQSRVSEDQEKLRQIDRKIADHAAQNLVIARLHSNGVLNSSEYSEQVSAIENKIEKLQVERKRLLACDETNELLRMIKMLNDILSDYNPTEYFDTELFEQIIQSITVESSTELTFHLIGGIDLTECIPGKGRRKTV